MGRESWNTSSCRAHNVGGLKEGQIDCNNIIPFWKRRETERHDARMNFQKSSVGISSQAQRTGPVPIFPTLPVFPRFSGIPGKTAGTS